MAKCCCICGRKLGIFGEERYKLAEEYIACYSCAQIFRKLKEFDDKKIIDKYEKELLGRLDENNASQEVRNLVENEIENIKRVKYEAEKKKELQVAALENGTAIDHIPPSQLFKVAKLLGLENMDNTITIGNNFHSNKMGSKGMIKISDKFFCDEEINRIALIAPNVILNIIRDYEVVEKKTVTLPDELVGLVKCNNPKCITNNEPMPTRFDVIDKEKGTIRCHYCERKINKEDIIVK
mgnify:CR=1 FL=1